MRQLWRMVIGTLAVLPCAGCGSSTGLDLASVRGTVTYKGQPVQNGTIVFEPDVSKNTDGPTGSSPIAQDGSYVLSTSSGGDGTIVGFHKVGITGLELEPVASASGPAATPQGDSMTYLKGKAKTARQSTTRGGAAGSAETFTDRAGRSFRYVIPKKLSDPKDSGVSVEVRHGSNQIDFNIKEDESVEIKK